MTADDFRKFPEVSGSRWLKVPEAADLLDLSERAARDWLRRYEIPSRGDRPVQYNEAAILDHLRKLGKLPRKSPEVPPEAPGSAPGVDDEPIEVAHQLVTPAALSLVQAEIEDRYLGTIEQLRLDHVGQVEALKESSAGWLAEKDRVIAGKDETIQAKDQFINALQARVAALEGVKDAEGGSDPENAETATQRVWWRFWNRA